MKTYRTYLLVAALVLVAMAAAQVAYFAWVAHQQGIGRATERAVWVAQTEKQKVEAARILAKEAARVEGIKAALNAALYKQELTDAKNKDIVRGLNRRLADLVVDGRLRDESATVFGCGLGGSGAEGGGDADAFDSHADRALPGGLLSKQLSGRLIKLTDEADQINIAYISCRADALQIREQLKGR